MLNGKCIIIQAIIGGHMQFLAKAQGMPLCIETALINIMSKFIWDQGTKPRIAMDSLRCPIHEGGLNLLNIKARNEAIEIIWLKVYLNFSLSCQKWATVMDHIILAAAPTHSVKKSKGQPIPTDLDSPAQRTMSETPKRQHQENAKNSTEIQG
jgi:hypothetical protein